MFLEIPASSGSKRSHTVTRSPNPLRVNPFLCFDAIVHTLLDLLFLFWCRRVLLLS